MLLVIEEFWTASLLFDKLRTLRGDGEAIQDFELDRHVNSSE
jgi:hypothetical protein